MIKRDLIIRFRFVSFRSVSFIQKEQHVLLNIISIIYFSIKKNEEKSNINNKLRSQFYDKAKFIMKLLFLLLFIESDDDNDNNNNNSLQSKYSISILFIFRNKQLKIIYKL